MIEVLPALAGALVGAILGSFIATIIIRWPLGQSVVAGRSRCDQCGTALSPTSLIPIVSYALARGRCRQCDARIDPMHLQVELAAAVIAAAALLAFPDSRGIALTLLGLQLLVLAWLDWRHFWLPDRLTLALALSGLTLGGLLGVTLVDRIIGAVAGGITLSLVAMAYRRARSREGLGDGDAKLMAALGAWLGWQMLPTVLLAAAVIGLIVASSRRLSRLDSVPFGTMLCGAAWFAAFWIARSS